jgi:membrane protein
LATHIEKAFNAVWGLAGRKNFLRRFSSYLTVTLLTPIMLAVLSSAGVLVRSFCDRIFEKIPFGATVGIEIAAFLLDLFPILLVCIIFALIYLWVPNTKVRLSSALLGGLVAGVLFQLLQDVFILMQGTIFRYNKIYGSFSVLPLFLIWLQWSWQIAIFGAELTFVDQNYSSGLFDKTSENKLSIHLRRTYQLAILNFIFRRFEEGRGAVPENGIVEYTKIAPVIVQVLLAELVENGQLALSEGEEEESRYYLPALSPEKLRINDSVGLLNRAGINDLLPGSAVEIERVKKRLDLMEENQSRIAGNVFVKDL